VNRSLEDRRFGGLVRHFVETFVDHVGDLAAVNLRNFTAFAPIHVSRSLLALMSIRTHIEQEVLVHQEREVLAFGSWQRRVRFARFVQHDIGQMRLDLLAPKHILLSELKCLFRIVIKLDRVFVLLVGRLTAENIGDFLVSLLFPATSVTLEGNSISDGFADDLNPTMTTFAVVAHLGLTRHRGTFLAWVAGSLTPVLALWAYFIAP